MTKETVEVVVQTYALLFYNGYTMTQSADDVVLSDAPKYIMLFSGFIAANCISISVLWLFYANRPLSCHGLLFHGILYSADAIFDIFYAMYPLIVVSDGQPNMTTLASLNTERELSVLCYVF